MTPVVPAGTSGYAQERARGLRDLVWAQVCRHLDGLAIGSTVAALYERGGLRDIVMAPSITAGELTRRLAANPGFLQVALRLLADQGWITGSGPWGTPGLTVQATPAGRVVLGELAGVYAAAAGFLPAAEQFSAAATGPGAPAVLGAYRAAVDLMRAEWQVPPGLRPVHARHQVVSHCDGHVVAPVLAELARQPAVRASGELRVSGTGWHPDVFGLAMEVLGHQGWATAEDGTIRLTPAGTVAAACARQYWHPVTYIPTFRRVPDLLFGDAPAVWAGTGPEERHLDRRLDIRLSGEVFAATCRQPFLDIAVPLFEGEAAGRQPALVIDWGCGDGTVLETLYTAVRETTARGSRLGEQPLLMAGIEPSQVAREVAARRLRARGIPHVILDGDIGRPDAAVRALAALGLDAADALHVSKSVIHDRAYAEAPPPPPGSAPPPVSAGAFATPDGRAVPADQVALSLAAFFRQWRPLARRHGLLVMEAHAVAPGTAAALIGRCVATELDATHGYSCQYPVEPEVFAWAARAAGLESRAHHEIGQESLGHTALTIDHFLVRG